MPWRPGHKFGDRDWYKGLHKTEGKKQLLGLDPFPVILIGKKGSVVENDLNTPTEKG